PRRSSRTHTDAGDVGAGLGDVARDVAARPEGQPCPERRDALAHEEVEVIERARTDAHEGVVRTDLRIRHVPDRELFRPPEFRECERFHALRPSPVFVAFTSTAMLPYGCLLSSMSW